MMPDIGPQISRARGRRQQRRRGGLREIFTICLLPVAFVVAGVAIDGSARWELARNTLRAGNGAEISADTKLGRILGRLARGDIEVALRRVAPETAPSSLMVEGAELQDAPLVLSVFVDDEALNDPETGVLANPLARGREWERAAYVSYFRFGELVHASRIGLRRHGGAGRRTGRRLSWRLYFRSEYASDAGPTSALLGLTTPTSRIVVRKMEPRIPNLLAFEIARRNGALAPASVPARLVLNGEDAGSYLISEHVNPEGWGRSHYGHGDFSMFVYKGMRSTDERSLARYQELEEWVQSAPEPMTMADAAERVDLDNLARHMMTFFFAGTDDWSQGAAVRDNTRPDATWSFVHWDLDHSFRERPGWNSPAIDAVLHQGRPGASSGVRARLLSRLINEDMRFRRYLADLLTELLDQRMTEEFLTDLLDRHAHLLPPRQFAALREFFANRPGVLRSDLRDLLESEQEAPTGRPTQSAAIFPSTRR